MPPLDRLDAKLTPPGAPKPFACAAFVLIAFVLNPEFVAAPVLEAMFAIGGVPAVPPAVEAIATGFIDSPGGVG